MFNGLSAWFSESVDQETVHKWVCNGGRRSKKVVDAEYCFSASCCVEDTKNILEPDPKRRRYGFPVTVIHPLFIDKSLSEQRLLPNTTEFALPSEQLLPTVAQQRGAKDRWLLDLLKIHRSHLDDPSTESTSGGLALDKHLGLKRKASPAISAVLPRSEETAKPKQPPAALSSTGSEKPNDLKRKVSQLTSVSPQSAEPHPKQASIAVQSNAPDKCNDSIFACPNPSSVSLKDITLSKCQLRLLRLHGTVSAN